MFQSGIALSKPTLGGLVSSMSPSVIIAPVNVNRPYIMGSVVAGLVPTSSKNSTKAIIKKPANANIKGVMSLGMPQIEQRGHKGFVKDGYANDYNNIGMKGAFWCALDLANFDKTQVDALTDNGVLSADDNGVLSFGATAAANTIAVNGKVLNYYDTPIISAINETISVGGTQYTFNYAKGIGAILVVID